MHRVVPKLLAQVLEVSVLVLEVQALGKSVIPPSRVCILHLHLHLLIWDLHSRHLCKITGTPLKELRCFGSVHRCVTGEWCIWRQVRRIAGIDAFSYIVESHTVHSLKAILPYQWLHKLVSHALVSQRFVKPVTLLDCLWELLLLDLLSLLCQGPIPLFLWSVTRRLYLWIASSIVLLVRTNRRCSCLLLNKLFEVIFTRWAEEICVHFQWHRIMALVERLLFISQLSLTSWVVFCLAYLLQLLYFFVQVCY